MRDFGTDGVRAAGPEVVWHGPEDAPVVVVLDPAGEAKHDELPATWRPLAEHLRIGWCRLPAGAEVFDQPPRSAPVHLVAAGTAVEPALRLAQRHSGSVRSLTAIDPVPAEASAVDDQHDWWDRDTAPVRQELTERGVRVHGFVSRDSDPTIRIEPPVPLGHPHVVARVVQLLRSVDPGRPELAQAWQTVREQVGPALERAEETGRTT
ncbi:MAG: hypothetical protein ACJ72N_17895 [Labedaea sp.]